MRTIANSFIILGFIDNKRILDNMSSFVEFPHCKIIDRSIFDEAILNMLSDGYKKYNDSYEITLYGIYFYYDYQYQKKYHCSRKNCYSKFASFIYG